MTDNGTWTYTWKQGRQLASMSGSGTWTFTYDANGMRTKRTNGSTTYSYIYDGSQLSAMSVGSNQLYFSYDAFGTPQAVVYNGTQYRYITNLQGDIVEIRDANDSTVVTYTYDAWGKLLDITGTKANTLGTHNPLRYRGYVYDTETELYYLQSRYYNPTIGRFINADSYASTVQGVLGNNMFAYCNNNPVCFADPSGYIPLCQYAYACFEDGSGYAPNIEFLMAFYGVDSYNEIPQMPEGAMIFVENITSVSLYMGVGIVEGRTIVLDANKYCEYTFVGIG